MFFRTWSSFTQNPKSEGKQWPRVSYENTLGNPPPKGQGFPPIQGSGIETNPGYSLGATPKYKGLVLIRYLSSCTFITCVTVGPSRIGHFGFLRKLDPRLLHKEGPQRAETGTNLLGSSVYSTHPGSPNMAEIWAWEREYGILSNRQYTDLLSGSPHMTANMNKHPTALTPQPSPPNPVVQPFFLSTFQN